MAVATTAEIAAEFGTTPRILRKFLRADFKNREMGEFLPGKGSRYAIEKKEIRSLKKRFEEWQTAQESAKESAETESE